MACRAASAATCLPGSCLIRCRSGQVLEGLLADTRKARGKRHPLPSLVSVAVAGTAAALSGPLAIAQAAACWDQEVLAAHGCWVSPRTGLRVAPSASMLDMTARITAWTRTQFEAALTAAVAALALDPAVPAALCRAPRAAAGASRRKSGRSGNAKRAGGGELPGGEAGRLASSAPPAAPVARTLPPAGIPGTSPHARAVAVDEKERKGAKAAVAGKCTLLAAVTHTPGIVITQDRVAESREGSTRSATSSRCSRRCRSPGPSSPATPCRRTGTTPCSSGRSRTRHSAVAHPGQPAEPERDPECAVLGNHARRRRDQRDQPRPDRDPHHPRPACPRRHWL